MTQKTDDILLSELADGELSAPAANELLLRVLDDPQGRSTLKQYLTLRQATDAWRSVQLDPPPAAPRPRRQVQRTPWRLRGMAVAACLGGALVLAGVVAVRLGDQPRPGPVAVREQPAPAVTADQMQQVAKIFAFQESVAGPLAWYAADDRSIRMSTAEKSATAQAPVAVLLKLASLSAGEPAKSVVIVCRRDEQATIDLPGSIAGRQGLRVTLVPRDVAGRVEIQYAIAVGKGPGSEGSALLAGQRRLGLADASLGQLALGEETVAVNAAAWTLKETSN